MDNAKAVCVAKALGWKFHEWNEEHNFMRYDSPDLKYQEMHEAEIEAIAALLDERDALRFRAEQAENHAKQFRDHYQTALDAWEEEIRLRDKLSAELASRTSEYCTAIANLQAENERLRKQLEARP